MLARIISSASVIEYEWSVLSSRHNESEKRLPKSCLVVLCKFEPVLHWTKECDNLLYQTLVEILIPDVLRPIPSKLVRLISIQKCLVRQSRLIDSFTACRPEKVREHWSFNPGVLPSTTHLHPFSLFSSLPPSLMPQVP